MEIEMKALCQSDQIYKLFENKFSNFTKVGTNIDKLLLNGDVIITKLDPSLVWENGYIGTDGAIVRVQSGTYQFTAPIPVVKGQIVRAIGATGNSVNIISEYIQIGSVRNDGKAECII